MVPLDLLCPGELGRVVEIDGDESLVVRLAEMGVRPGTEVRMLRAGSPCILAVENRRVSFRGDKAAAILVELIGKQSDGEVASGELLPSSSEGLGAPEGLGASSVLPSAGASASVQPPASSAAAAASRVSGGRGGILGRWLRAC